ncbi:hypothetical protein V6N13_065661 [Hibiscus sabdariffa]
MVHKNPKCSALPSNVASKEQLRKVFFDCDIDDNSILTKEEIKKAFDRFGSAFPGFRSVWIKIRTDASAWRSLTTSLTTPINVDTSTLVNYKLRAYALVTQSESLRFRSLLLSLVLCFVYHQSLVMFRYGF